MSKKNICTDDIFEAVKRQVTATDVAVRYGFTPSRGGFITCPFHTERTPSLKLYPEARGWYCFGCHTGGSVIDFVMRLFDLPPLEAVKRMNEDFALGLPIGRTNVVNADKEAENQRKRLFDLHNRFDKWQEDTIRMVNRAYLLGWRALNSKTPELWTEGETMAIRKLRMLENWSTDLSSGDMERMMDIFRSREGVESTCMKILNGSHLN